MAKKKQKAKKKLKRKEIVFTTAPVKKLLKKRIKVVSKAVKQLQGVSTRTQDADALAELVNATAVLDALNASLIKLQDACAFQNQNAGLVVVFNDK